MFIVALLIIKSFVRKKEASGEKKEKKEEMFTDHIKVEGEAILYC